jgi:hypothetical protein
MGGASGMRSRQDREVHSKPSRSDHECLVCQFDDLRPMKILKKAGDVMGDADAGSLGWWPLAYDCYRR